MAIEPGVFLFLFGASGLAAVLCAVYDDGWIALVIVGGLFLFGVGWLVGRRFPPRPPNQAAALTTTPRPLPTSPQTTSPQTTSPLRRWPHPSTLPPLPTRSPPISPQSFCIQLPRRPTEHCLICLNPLEENLLLLPCKHTYHKTCILKWFRRRPTCPYCSQSVLKP